MKQAIETTLFAKMKLQEAMKAIARSGFNKIEIGLSHLEVAKVSKKDVQGLKSILSENGLSICAVFGLYALGSSEPRQRESAVDRMKKTIQTARDLGSNLVVSELGGSSHETKILRSAFERSVKELLPAAEDESVTLAFEAHCGDFIERSNEAVDLIRSFHSKNVRYVYCIPHTFTLGGSSMKNISYAKGVLNYVHVADTLTPERTFFSATYAPKVKPHQHLIPGEGDVNFKEVFSALNEIHYEGYLVLDPFSHMDCPEYAAVESKKRVERLIKDGRLP